VNLRRALSGDRRNLVSNVVARVLALIALGLATVVVARVSGPSGVGVFALLRVLPGLVGVVVSGGLPTGVPYFFAQPDRRGLRATVVVMMVVAGIAGSLLWAVGAGAIQQVFFSDLSRGLVVLAGCTVFTQLLVATAKGASQGRGDLPGANQVIVLEELMFLPAYGVLWLTGTHGTFLIIVSLLAADLATALVAWRRLARRGYFFQIGLPSAMLGREVWWYGTRGEIGAVLSLLNLRLDFALLDVFAGTAVVGTYAVASKFAELVRLVPVAITYVLYPRFSRETKEQATADTRRMLGPATALSFVCAVVLALIAPFVLPLLYGAQFDAAVELAQLLLVGLSIEGAAGVISAYLYGTGRPGLNSLAMGAGVVLTVVLDLLLVPGWGATGAAIASTAAYIVTTVTLLLVFRASTPRRELAPEPISWRMS
jgi:O-antigen/teichoic acid export membrane protein